MEEIKQRLRDIFTRALRLPAERPIRGETNLVKSLGVDSITAMEILIWVEDEFKIVIEDQDLSPALVDSFDALAAYVSRARARSPLQ